MIVEFERETDYKTRQPSTTMLCDVGLDGDVTLRLASDDVAGDREWRITELWIGSGTYDVAEGRMASVRHHVEPPLCEGEVLDAVRKAWAEYVAAEG